MPPPLASAGGRLYWAWSDAPLQNPKAAKSASQRADHAVPYALCCKALGVSESWFYKWHERPPTPRQARRTTLDKAVREAFEASERRYGSPRVYDDLVNAGWAVSEKTVAVSMRSQPGRAAQTPLPLLDLARQGGRAFRGPGQPRLQRCGPKRQVVRRPNRTAHQ